MKKVLVHTPSGQEKNSRIVEETPMSSGWKHLVSGAADAVANLANGLGKPRTDAAA
jgi:hypothetical protein